MRRQLCVAYLIAFLTTSCVAQELFIHYTFDEGSGVALDTGTGTPANGVLGADATRSTDTPGGKSGYSLDLRAAGANSMLNAGDVEKVDTLDRFTLTTWLKLEGLNADQGGSGNVRLLAKQAGGDFNGVSWNINNPLEGTRGIDNFRTGLFIGGEDGFAFAQAEESVSADNQWIFLAVSYDSLEPDEDTIFYYGDETTETVVIGDEIPATIAVGPVASTAGEADFGIGFTDAAPGLDFAAKGFQDDVRVYRGVLTLEQLEAVRLENLPSLTACDRNSAGDLDGNGDVEFADFLVLSANFGQAVNSHAQGDIDCNGLVEFADFLVLSGNFGSSLGVVTSVPEPVGNMGLYAFPVFILLVARRRSFR